LQKRNKHPHFGKFGFIYGKIHFGENVANAAKRELKEKTNFDLEPVHRGEVYIIEKNKTEIINHTLFHVFLISNLDDNLMVENIFGEFIWGKVEDIKEDEKIPGTEEIKNMIEKSKNNFFAEITIEN
jgi:ADP-ribose pyrophosphatase YjhB (NUDIX family)